MDEHYEVDALLTLDEVDLLMTVSSDLGLGQSRGRRANRVWIYLAAFGDDVTARLCEAIKKIRLDDLSLGQGAALIADVLLSSTGKVAPFSLVVYILRFAERDLCGQTRA